MEAAPSRKFAEAVWLVVTVAGVGIGACTYNFDRFAVEQDAQVGSGTQQGGSGGTVSATGGAAGAAATGGQSGSGAGGSAASGGVGADAGAGGRTGSCAGPTRGGICWYLGGQGSSCQQVCAIHGQPAPEAATHVGTASQGGSLAECKILFGLLGVGGAPANGTRSDGVGLGCHVYENSALWWLTSPNFSVSASHASAKLVCGCTF
jgi:hypothetical protein